jgi:hypothetical protein
MAIPRSAVQRFDHGTVTIRVMMLPVGTRGRERPMMTRRSQLWIAAPSIVRSTAPSIVRSTVNRD